MSAERETRADTPRGGEAIPTRLSLTLSRYDAPGDRPTLAQWADDILAGVHGGWHGLGDNL